MKIPLTLLIALGLVGALQAQTVILMSADGQGFMIEKSIAKRSSTLKDVIKDAGIEEPIPLPSINGKVLGRVVLSLHKLDTLLTSNEKAKDKAVYIPRAFQPTVNELLNDTPNKEVIALFTAANYLGMPFLYNAVAAVVADRLSKKGRLAVEEGTIPPVENGLDLKKVPRELFPLIQRHVGFRLCGIEREYSVADYITENGQPPLEPCSIADEGVHLSNKGLTSLFGTDRLQDSANGEAKSIDLLDLSGNCFQDLTTDTQGLEKPFGTLAGLTLINLSDNKLTRLSDQLFSGLEHLWAIKLGKNRLKELPGSALVDQKKLRSIDLSNNLFISVPVSAFTDKPVLVKINLEGNKLNGLPIGDFAKLPSVKNQYLNTNEISSIYPIW